MVAASKVDRVVAINRKASEQLSWVWYSSPKSSIPVEKRSESAVGIFNRVSPNSFAEAIRYQE